VNEAIQVAAQRIMLATIENGEANVKALYIAASSLTPFAIPPHDLVALVRSF